MRFAHAFQEFHRRLSIHAEFLRRDIVKRLRHERFVEFDRLTLPFAEQEELTVERGVELGLDGTVLADFLPFQGELHRGLLGEVRGIGIAS